MTFEEASNLANRHFDDFTHDKEIQDFIATESKNNLQQFIHRLNRDGYSRYFNLAYTTLQIRLAEDAIRLAENANLTADKLAKQTDRLVRYTIGLNALTFVLAFLGFVQILIAFFDYCSKNH